MREQENAQERFHRCVTDVSAVGARGPLIHDSPTGLGRSRHDMSDHFFLLPKMGSATFSQARFISFPHSFQI